MTNLTMAITEREAELKEQIRQLRKKIMTLKYGSDEFANHIHQINEATKELEAERYAMQRAKLAVKFLRQQPTAFPSNAKFVAALIMTALAILAAYFFQLYLNRM